MSKDYKMFSKTREIFPPPPDYQSNRMICGHLNRLKAKPDPYTYLSCRKDKVPEVIALARASRCLCLPVGTPKRDKIKEIQSEAPEKKIISFQIDLDEYEGC